ncbi:cuticle protein 16.8-like [Ixodes scapularis]|uniref:cuticle protein 16.8-like n=1 Tax=Ixodes scapularis TaxID=6945 RepID=UPI001A9D8CB3|nr:cuticle protein 16.8-like [Ixodes scapularis]
MFSKALLCCLAAYVAAQVAVENNPPQPYNFAFDNTDEFGTRLTRQETGDEFNGKVGSYSYTDAAGVYRTVNYVADAAGFRATVNTNEPGTKTSEPADATTVSAAVEGPHPVSVKAVRPASVVVKAVGPAPVLLKAVHPAPVAFQAVHASPVALHAVHAGPVAYAQQAAPVVYAQHASPVAYSLGNAPLTYTLGKRA